MSNENKTNEPKINTGFMHKTKEKSKPESPDFFGRMDINGDLYSIAGWTKTGNDSDAKFIQINLDLEGNNPDQQAKLREANLNAFKEERKDKANKDRFILIEGTGNIHKANSDKNEDLFGTVKLNGNFVSLIGFHMKGKKGDYAMLKVSTGLASKEERAKMSNDFL